MYSNGYNILTFIKEQRKMENYTKETILKMTKQELHEARRELLKGEINDNCSNCSYCSRCSYCSYCSYCSDCSYCSHCSDCSYCSNCSDCLECSDCSDCSHSVGLKKGRYLICNVQLTEEEYQTKIKELNL